MEAKGIAEIVPEEGPFPLEVRVVKKFTPFCGKQASKHHFFLLTDAKGDAIEARVDVNDRRLNSILKEGLCYNIDGHVCTTQRAAGRVVKHEASIVMADRAVVKEIPDEAIPKLYFDFATYEMLEERHTSENADFTDYLGLIESVTNVFKRKEYNMLKIKLLDESCKNVMVTLWENFAFNFNRDNVVGKVLAISSAKVTKHQESFQLESTDVTTLYVNPEIPNIKEITETLHALQVRMKTNNALQLAHIASESGITIAGLMMKQANEFKNRTYTVAAHIKSYEAHRRWFNAKCPAPNCVQQLFKERGAFICPNNHDFPCGIFTFCLNATIVDDSGMMPVVFYDDEMQQLLQTTCKTMVLEQGHDNSRKIPPALENFIGKKMLFTLRLRVNNPAVIQSATPAYDIEQPRVDQMLLAAAVPKTPANKPSRARTLNLTGKNEPQTKKAKAD